MDDNPYQPPMTAREPEVEVGEVVVSEQAGRLCASVGLWMRIAGIAFVTGGGLWLLSSLQLLEYVSDLHSAVVVVPWLLPALLLVLAGIFLLRSGNAFAAVPTGMSTLAAAFSNLRWHLIAIGCAPLAQVVLIVDWPWEHTR